MKSSSLWILITFPIPFQKTERKLSYIWLHYKKVQRVSGQSLPCQKPSVQGTYYTEAGSGLLGSGTRTCPLTPAEQFVSIRRAQRTQMYLCVLIVNEANYLLFTWNQWKSHPLKHEYNLFLPCSRLPVSTYIKFLKFVQWSQVYMEGADAAVLWAHLIAG